MGLHAPRVVAASTTLGSMNPILRVLVPLLCLGAAHPGPAHASEPWVPPLADDVEVVRGFDPPARRWQPGHRGVDLVTTPGAEVRAVGAGTVTFAGVLAGRGVVTVTHGRLRTTYEPVTASVGAGDRVGAGEIVGRLQPGHGRPGPGAAVLHWGLLRGVVYLDPMSLLRQGPPRLLPHWAALGAAPGSQRPTDSAMGTTLTQEARLTPVARSGRGSPRPAGRVVAAMALVTVAVAVRRRGPP